ncbi:MAG: ERAP1-like C-terminal domain-containing protein [Pedococcus sp.]
MRTERLELDVDGESTDIPELIGRRVPDLVLVNDDDLAYAKIRLDQRSLGTALAHPRGFQDSLPRALVLGAAWDMTRDAEMGARDFVKLVLASLPGETDSTLLRTLLAQLSATLHLYVAPEHREQTTAETVAGLRDLATSAAPGSDAQLQLVGAFAAQQRGADHAAYLRDLLDGTQVLDGLAVDTDMRWRLLISLAASGAATVEDIDAEQQRDNTATGHERAEQARAAFPTAEAKATAWRRGVEEDGLTTTVLEAVAAGFGNVHDTSLLAPYVEKYHAMLDTVETKASHAVIEVLVRGFYPTALADAHLRDSTQSWLTAHPEAPAAMRRLVAENRDPIARALRAQQRDIDA